MADKKSSQNTNLMLVITYFILFAVNALVILLANAYFPQQVALGTLHITKNWAIIHSMGTLALINTFAIPIIREFEKKKGRMLTNKEWLLKYFLINFIGIWFLARFADDLGFGIASWRVALVLAVVLDILQGMAMMQV